MDVEVIQVIKTRLLRRGSGRDGETMRIVEQYWDMDGGLLWEIDTWTGQMYSPLARDLSKSEHELTEDCWCHPRVLVVEGVAGHE